MSDLIAALEKANAEELAAYDDVPDDHMQFCFFPPDGWPHRDVVWGSSPTLAALLERRPEYRGLRLSTVWSGANCIWPYVGSGAWEDA